VETAGTRRRGIRVEGAPVRDRIKLVVINYYAGPIAVLDDDNMVKPIRDVLIGLVYVDDGQIADMATRQTSIDGTFRVRLWPLVLLQAFAVGRPFVYVKVELGPDHAELLT